MKTPSPALVERAKTYVEDNTNLIHHEAKKVWSNHLASFAEEVAKERAWKVFRDYDKETGLTENELKRAFENYWETRNKERTQNG